MFWRTDEGACPYFGTLSLIKETPISKQRRRLFISKKRLLHFEEGVPLHRREASFISKKRPLCLLIAVFTPLSIRRGVGGEASSLPFGEVGWGFNIRRGVGGEAPSLPLGGVGGGSNIRRGAGGEAVDGLEVRLVVVGYETLFFLLLHPLNDFTIR